MGGRLVQVDNEFPWRCAIERTSFDVTGCDCCYCRLSVKATQMYAYLPLRLDQRLKMHRQIYPGTFPSQCIPLGHCVSVNSWWGEIMEACYHNQTGKWWCIWISCSLCCSLMAHPRCCLVFRASLTIPTLMIQLRARPIPCSSMWLVFSLLFNNTLTHLSQKWQGGIWVRRAKSPWAILLLDLCYWRFFCLQKENTTASSREFP